jgi:hypothetical protein
MPYESSCRPSAAEFPHDNPLFDRCALWDASALEFALPAPEPTIEVVTQVVAEAASESEPAVEVATTSEPDSAPEIAPETSTDSPDPDPIAAFVAAVTEVALAHGPADTAGQIESLFTFGTLDPEALSETAQAALFEGKILVRTDEGVRPSEAFAMTRMAWQSILRGESGDLSACGDSTLDTWTADLVARLIAHPDKAQTIRRDLRRRGIAAFGMLS